jgi:hypothetical protein
MKWIYRLILSVVLGLFSPSLAVYAQSATVSVKHDAPRVYTVVEGDTLWRISEMYLDDPWRWPELWQRNSQVTDPHWIYPGDRLQLSWNGSTPSLSKKARRTLSPKINKIPKQAISTLAKPMLMRYLKQQHLMSDSQLQQQAQLLGSSRGLSLINSNDLLYLDGYHDVQHWGVYRTSERYQVDESKEAMTQVTLIASASTVNQQSAVTTVQVNELIREVRPSDILLPLGQPVAITKATMFQPKPAPELPQIQTLGAFEKQTYLSKGSGVVLGVGREQGIELGSTFVLDVPSNELRFSDGTAGLGSPQGAQTNVLPTTRIGSLMVIQVYDEMSIAVVTQSLQPIPRSVWVRSPLSEKHQARLVKEGHSG